MSEASHFGGGLVRQRGRAAGMLQLPNEEIADERLGGRVRRLEDHEALVTEQIVQPAGKCRARRPPQADSARAAGPATSVGELRRRQRSLELGDRVVDALVEHQP